MTQYIPKAAIAEEIENRIDRCNNKKWSCPANTQVEALCDNKICAYKEIFHCEKKQRELIEEYDKL